MILPRQLGLGCMRLSTAEDRDEARAIEVIHAALDAGVTLLDTADAYALHDGDIGHNERLIARALASWDGDRARITVATKGGLIRPGGRWEHEGRAKHLRAACDASRAALGVERIDLYQLHAPDPEVSIATSVRALAALKAEGKIGAIGLCNVTVTQLEAALAVTEIASVQVSLGPYAEESFRGGIVERCAALGIQVIAHSPLGGPKKKGALAKHRVLARVAERRGVTPAQLVLAWLGDLCPAIVPIPGATRVESAAALKAVASLVLEDADREALEAAFPFARVVRVPRASRRPARSDRDVVVLMGIQAAGKSTAVRRFTAEGYVRLNRDEEGGRIAGLHAKLDRLLAEGVQRIVLDNTYAARAPRNEVIETAWRHGAHARCVWLDTPIEEAQINAVLRLLDRHGALLGGDALKAAAKKDPNAFGPDVLFRYQRALEPPSLDEGFESVEVVPFTRTWAGHDRRAWLIEADALLEQPLRGALGDPIVVAGRADRVRAAAAEGFAIVVLGWVPEVSAGAVPAEDVEAAGRKIAAALGVELRFLYCPHGAGPAVCWCRRPLPGLGVQAIRELRLDPRACRMMGRSTADRTFSERLGFDYVAPEEL